MGFRGFLAVGIALVSKELFDGILEEGVVEGEQDFAKTGDVRVWKHDMQSYPDGVLAVQISVHQWWKMRRTWPDSGPA